MRFGVFEAHLTTGELFKTGRRVRIQQQPFEVLRALLEDPGQLVTREMLRQRLWSDGTTVEFDRGLNKSVTKLREALGDSASHPRFVETLPKRGYRFIAPVSRTEATTDTPGSSPSREPDPTEVAVEPQVTVLAESAAWSPLKPSRSLRLAGAVALMLLIALTGSPPPDVEARAERAALRAPVVTEPIHAARDAFDRGQIALVRRTPESLSHSVEHFGRAVALSPRFADAYVGLADAWSFKASEGLVDPREGMPRARDAANRALTIDPANARAHASLGRTTTIFDWDWVTARWHFARAQSLSRGDATIHEWHAEYLSARGEHRLALNEARRATAAAPLSLGANAALGLTMYLARQFDEAAEQLERTLAMDPDFARARRYLGLVRVQQGQLSGAIDAFERVVRITGSPSAQAELAWARALNGEADAARAALADLDRLRSSTFVSPDSVALVYSGLGAHDAAVAWLTRAFTMRVAWLAHLPVDPMWDSLRDDPRVEAMVRAIRRE